MGDLRKTKASSWDCYHVLGHKKNKIKQPARKAKAKHMKRKAWKNLGKYDRSRRY
jgi:hypothetical protein